jgi:hypothetical protein
MYLSDQDNCFQPHFTHSMLCAVRTVRFVYRCQEWEYLGAGKNRCSESLTQARKIIFLPVTSADGRDSSVSIATRYGLHGPGIESWWRSDSPQPFRPALGPTLPPIKWVQGPSQG